MTEAQFRVIAKLFRVPSKSATREVLRKILVDGCDNIEARKGTFLTKQAIHNGIKRYREAHALIKSAYEKGRDHAEKNIKNCGGG